jgi:hypothetical protein
VKRIVVFLVVAVAASAMALATPALPTASAGDAFGKFGGTRPELGVGLLVSVPGGADGGGHQTYAAGDPTAPRPVFTRAVPASSGDGGGLSNLCRTPDGPHGPAFPLGNGWNFYIELFATRTGAYLSTIGIVCVPLDPDAAEAVPPAPVVAQPPTIGEIWRAVGLPTPPVGVSPAAKGITGLPTWVWTNGSIPASVGANLLGYRITGTAHLVGYGAFPGEGGWVRSRTPGRAGDPAFAHTYEQTGTYRLGVATLWTATAVMTGPGLDAPLTINLGTAVVTNARDYAVVQIRSRLLDE